MLTGKEGAGGKETTQSDRRIRYGRQEIECVQEAAAN